MKLQLITDLRHNLVAVQLPIQEYLRLKQAAGEPIEQFAGSMTQPKTEPQPVIRTDEEASTELDEGHRPKIRQSASITEILGRSPDEEYKHYTHTIEGSWLGKPKRGQRTAGPTKSPIDKDKCGELPRIGSQRDRKRYWSEGRGARKRNRK